MCWRILFTALIILTFMIMGGLYLNFVENFG